MFGGQFGEDFRDGGAAAAAAGPGDRVAQDAAVGLGGAGGAVDVRFGERRRFGQLPRCGVLGGVVGADHAERFERGRVEPRCGYDGGAAASARCLVDGGFGGADEFAQLDRFPVLVALDVGVQGFGEPAVDPLDFGGLFAHVADHPVQGLPVAGGHGVGEVAFQDLRDGVPEASLLVGVVQEGGEAFVGAAFAGAAQAFVRFEDFAHGQALGGLRFDHFLAQGVQHLFEAVAHALEVGGQGGGEVQDVAGGFDGGVVVQGRGSVAGAEGPDEVFAAGDLFFEDGDACFGVRVGFVRQGFHAGEQGVQAGGVQAGGVAGEAVQVGEEPDGGFGEFVDEASVGAGAGQEAAGHPVIGVVLAGPVFAQALPVEPELLQEGVGEAVEFVQGDARAGAREGLAEQGQDPGVRVGEFPAGRGL